ncbi:50S ribosomal protein L10 [Mesosutterella sp. AGMB02718]|uniref:Large ribosomal subunit protein uL10 n=1 Tax=Mesosutterella faecium TaxID=2925194 RepID=A0ABT7IK63_9BURK|nr:50S ribosomal protein L10 [Mesosutterella sp. AGMB02718]MDL2058768.1 50S ribosomal protein L10 [Mesosutterella sp. AGMB02718]
MGLNRQDKAAVIEEVKAIFAESSSLIFAEYRGLSVEAITALRAEARKNGVKLRVAKNTLVARAAAETPFACAADKFVGPLVYGFSADPVAVAKILFNFAKKNEAFVIKGGVMDGKELDLAGIEALSKLPSRDELLAKLMATMNEPIAKFVRTLNEVPARFVRTVAAVRDSKEKAAA